MKIEDMGDYDGAILLLTKGDEIHVRSTENISPQQFYEIVVNVADSVDDMLQQANALITRTLQ